MRIVPFLILFFPILAFSQINQTDANGLRQGKWEKRSIEGRLIYEGSFKDGKPVGEWKRYHEKGQLKAEMIYKGDTAQTVLYDVWRKKVASGNYVNQKKEGIWCIYKDAQKVAEERYKNGLKHGVSRRYYSSREVMEETDWVQGEKDGNYQVYFKSGEPYLQCKMQNNKRHGLFLVYSIDGTQELVGEYKSNLRHGKWNYNNEKGELMYTLFYDEGQLLNPAVRDSVENVKMEDLEKGKGVVLDPEKFMDDPSGYMMKNKIY